MKKISLFIVSMLLIPVSILAATTPKIVTLTAENSGSTVNYSGTTEEGSHAVMCKLYNSDNEEVDLLSSPVDNESFKGSFTNVSNGTYNVACANYEGGEVKKVEVIVGNVDTESITNNPNTYDAGIRNAIILSIISIVGIVCICIYLKKKKGRK